MPKRLFQKKATAMLEYSALLVLVLAGFIAMHIYISRGFAGKWKDAGDSFGSGRQFDPDFTEECACSEAAHQWYNVPCFESAESSARVDVLYDDCYKGCGPQLVSNGGRYGLCENIVPWSVVDGFYEVPNDITECARCCTVEAKKAHATERAVACPGNCNQPIDEDHFGPEEFDCN